MATAAKTAEVEKRMLAVWVGVVKMELMIELGIGCGWAASGHRESSVSEGLRVWVKNAVGREKNPGVAAARAHINTKRKAGLGEAGATAARTHTQLPFETTRRVPSSQGSEPRFAPQPLACLLHLHARLDCVAPPAARRPDAATARGETPHQQVASLAQPRSSTTSPPACWSSCWRSRWPVAPAGSQLGGQAPPCASSNDVRPWSSSQGACLTGQWAKLA